MNMRILLTGASSFTGYHLIRALSQREARIWSTSRRAMNDYQGLSMNRLSMAKERSTLLEGMAFGSDSFINAIAKYSPDVLIHHGAHTLGYRSLAFDVQAAVASNCFRLDETLDAFRDAGGRHVWVTGSVFQGDGDAVLPISPYGVSKRDTANRFRLATQVKGLRFSEVIIPNPIGPYDNAKLCDYLFDRWSAQQEAVIKTPNWLRDNIFVDLLALAYTEVVLTDAVGRFAFSGMRSTMWAFAQKLAFETQRRTGWACSLIASPQREDSQPNALINSLDAIEWAPRWSEEKSWDDLVEWQRRRLRN